MLLLKLFTDLRYYWADSRLLFRLVFAQIATAVTPPCLKQSHSFLTVS